MKLRTVLKTDHTEYFMNRTNFQTHYYLLV